MTNEVLKHYEMFVRVQGVLESFSSTWESNPYLSQQKNLLDEGIELISLAENRVLRQNNAQAATKNELKGQLTGKLQEAQSVLQIYAEIIAAPDLVSKVGSGRTRISRAKDSDLKELGKVIIQEAEQAGEALAEFGFSAEDLQALKDLQAEYHSLVGKPLTSLHLQNAVKRKQKRTMLEVNEQVRTRIDAVMLPYRSKNQEFYDAYTQARTIIDRRVRLKGAEEEQEG